MNAAEEELVREELVREGVVGGAAQCQDSGVSARVSAETSALTEKVGGRRRLGSPRLRSPIDAAAISWRTSLSTQRELFKSFAFLPRKAKEKC